MSAGRAQEAEWAEEASGEELFTEGEKHCGSFRHNYSDFAKYVIGKQCSAFHLWVLLRPNPLQGHELYAVRSLCPCEPPQHVKFSPVASANAKKKNSVFLLVMPLVNC